MAILLQDDFNRASSTSVVGAPQIGPTAVTASGVSGIITNQFYASTAVSHVSWDLGTPNVEVSVTAAGLSSARTLTLMLGWSTTSDWWGIRADDANIWLYKGVNATTGAVLSAPRSAVSSSTQLKISYKDKFLRAYCDGVLNFYIELDDPLTATRVGLRSDHTAVRADDLLAIDSTSPVVSGYLGKSVDNYVLQSDPFFTPAFAYQGHDTKLQDQAAGS